MWSPWASLLMSQARRHRRGRAYARHAPLPASGDVGSYRGLVVMVGIYINRAEHKHLRYWRSNSTAQRQNPLPLFMAHHALGSVLGWLGELSCPGNTWTTPWRSTRTNPVPVTRNQAPTIVTAGSQGAGYLTRPCGTVTRR
jgi:hypothetical protein